VFLVHRAANASELDEIGARVSCINPDAADRRPLFSSATALTTWPWRFACVVSIAPYSDAYFALLKALPYLREAGAL